MLQRYYFFKFSLLDATEPKSHVNINNIHIGEDYIEKKHGVLNALCFASAEYLYKVFIKHKGSNLKKFNHKKLANLQRIIAHKNPHLDEYFAELLFRAILPYNLKDIEIVEHTLLSSENDQLAQVTWENAVIFGFNEKEKGSATALEFFDEHEEDGTRRTPSCSQIVTDRYFLNSLPKSVQLVLDEVNQIDSIGRAHSYNIANLIKKIHDTPYIVGYDDIQEKYISKHLTENWKRAIVSACITAIIYTFENNLLSEETTKLEDAKLNAFAKRSLNFFLQHTLLSEYEPNFYKIKGKIASNFREGNKTLAKTKSWKVKNGKKINQNLIIHKLAYALDRCWGSSLSNFIMAHLWQVEFQSQIAFMHIKQEIEELKYPQTETQTKFGTINFVELENPAIIPFQRKTDTIKKDFKLNQPIRIIHGSLTNPKYPNLATVLKNIINAKYQGFGIILLKDKMSNMTMVSAGSTIPYKFWKYVSDQIQLAESDRWFQLAAEGNYAEFILNRTKSRQEHLPTEKINLDFLKNLIKQYKVN